MEGGVEDALQFGPVDLHVGAGGSHEQLADVAVFVEFALGFHLTRKQSSASDN